MMMMMITMDCRYQEFRPFSVSGHEKLSISQGTLYAKGRFHIIIKRKNVLTSSDPTTEKLNWLVVVGWTEERTEPKT